MCAYVCVCDMCAYVCVCDMCAYDLCQRRLTCCQATTDALHLLRACVRVMCACVCVVCACVYTLCVMCACVSTLCQLLPCVAELLTCYVCHMCTCLCHASICVSFVCVSFVCVGINSVISHMSSHSHMCCHVCLQQHESSVTCGYSNMMSSLTYALCPSTQLVRIMRIVRICLRHACVCVNTLCRVCVCVCVCVCRLCELRRV